MTRAEAKQLLLLYRPGDERAPDAEMKAALELAQGDDELRRWFDEHRAFQAAMREKFQSVSPPADLMARLLAERKIVRPAVWSRPASWMAAAAAFALFAALAWFMAQPRVPERFDDYQARMVSTVLRQYRMDVVTNDLRALRSALAASGAPGDYSVPPGLGAKPLTGGGVLRWRNHPVTMVCFNRGDDQMLFLFVMDKSAVKDPPPAQPQVEQVNKLVTVSWSAGDKAYMLAGPPEPDFGEKYF
jgi:hypothetical protein